MNSHSELILKGELSKAHAENHRLQERWRRAEHQISAALKKHGLELHVDPDGNYSIVEKDT